MRIVLLSDADSLALWKLRWHGRDRMLLSSADLIVEDGVLKLTSTEPARLTAGVYPAEGGAGRADGVFRQLAVARPSRREGAVTAESLRPAGPPREVPVGRISQPVAAEPTDADFAKAAVWRIHLPPDLDLSTDPLLRIHYAGDVARLTLNGKLLNDDFYNGRVFDLGLKRYAPEILKGDLQLEILPLRRDAIEGPRQRVFIEPDAVPAFDAKGVALELRHVELVPRYEAEVRSPLAGD